jgi:hypothetical protein
MRKFIIIPIIIVVLATFAWTAENSFTNYPGTLPVYGYPGPTKLVYIDNGSRTIQSIYERGGGTWLGGPEGGVAPIGMFITCATTTTHWAFGGDNASVTVGHIFPAGSSWHFINPFWMSTGRTFGAGATDNVTCQMTPEY